MFEHITVLKTEAVEGLNIKENGIYVDCTLGGAGHSELILSKLSKKGHLFAFDQDQTAIDHANEKLANYVGQFTLIKSNFRYLKDELQKRDIFEVDGILFDLGVSSPQFDRPERGFSYQYDAPLDMRMDQDAELSAYDIVNNYQFTELYRIISRYGEEKFAKQIARHIEKYRVQKPIKTTFELVDIIKDSIPAPARRTGGHPAKRTFQALRIAVNNELGVFEEALTDAIEMIRSKGRISVITFHSLEDRICKTIFREHAKLPDLPPGLPVIPDEYQPKLKLITKKPIIPSDEEIAYNKRARSAKLRIAEKA